MPAPWDDLESQLAARPRVPLPTGLRARILADLAVDKAVPPRGFAWRWVLVAAAGILIAAAVSFHSNKDRAGNRDRSEAVGQELARAARQLEELGVSQREAGRGASLFYADSKLPRFYVPATAGVRVLNEQAVAELSEASNSIAFPAHGDHWKAL